MGMIWLYFFDRLYYRLDDFVDGVVITNNERLVFSLLWRLSRVSLRIHFLFIELSPIVLRNSWVIVGHGRGRIKRDRLVDRFSSRNRTVIGGNDLVLILSSSGRWIVVFARLVLCIGLLRIVARVYRSSSWWNAYNCRSTDFGRSNNSSNMDQYL